MKNFHEAGLLIPDLLSVKHLSFSQKLFKATGSGESSNTPTIKKSKRLADKQAFLKAIAAESSQQISSDTNDEYVPDKDDQPAFVTLDSGRKKRTATTSVSYKDYDLDEIEEDTPRKKRGKKLTPKTKEASASSSKSAKAVITRAKRSPGKAKEVEKNGPMKAVYIDTDDEVEETAIAQVETSKPVQTPKSSDIQDNKLKRLLQSKDSNLIQADFGPDQVIKNKKVTIRSDFGQVATNHCYEAAEKWQDILFLGGFDPEYKPATVSVEDDSFKDDNYEQHWGDRIKEFNEEKRKREETDVGRPNVKKAKGKGKPLDTRRGNPPRPGISASHHAIAFVLNVVYSSKKAFRHIVTVNIYKFLTGIELSFRKDKNILGSGCCTIPEEVWAIQLYHRDLILGQRTILFVTIKKPTFEPDNNVDVIGAQLLLDDTPMVFTETQVIVIESIE
ncbi:uncharacterized protein EV154DRAFT_555515 [Mucor mucedo]|uniref:uncharacterized protein n=1 Tax=Mucor mucedo TaxID=29922 RepID=UPI0022205675|nr:uncharacterized protein EV154DRAFT_555515 [Mucor mucedo]KAI7878107.1 hypothetical protein EV154DRAFT_555515 [Mucor mucedo]